MVEGLVGPSELHLKKELTVLRKARFLRDPETCSSWRSPVSTTSYVGTSLCGNELKGTVAQDDGSKPAGLPSRKETKRKKVFLHNWRTSSNQSSGIGMKSQEDDKQASAEGSAESQGNSQDLEAKSDTFLEVPVNIYRVPGSNSDTPVKRTVRKVRRNSFSRKGAIRKSVVSKLLENNSNSMRLVKNGEQSEDTENCNSENPDQLPKGTHGSQSASPLVASGCENWPNPAKLLKTIRKEGSSFSCTPISTSSYYRYGCRNPSTAGSTAASFDGDDLDQADLLKGQGCGIPCYWSKRIKDRGYNVTGHSPSLSDTLKRKGGTLLCGSQTLCSSMKISSNRRKYGNKYSRGSPLLDNSCDGTATPLGSVSDELSTNLGELDLEALSRLDGRRWSSCKSIDAIEMSVNGGSELDVPGQRSLSQKYRPKSFDEILCQSIVVQSLSNAVLRERIAPAYLFQGPRGTGKTSAARVFAAALNCQATEENKPCGICKECTDFWSGNGINLIEVDATNTKSLSRIRYLLKNVPVSGPCVRYKVLVIDECHMVSSKMWSAFMKFLDEPLPHVVFIFVTIDPDSLPRSVISRCQKYIFSKIRDVDIVCRLRKLSVKENLDIELDSLDLIASNSDGSLRDAEMMLDQLSLLGRKITPSLVNDLIGVVSEEKLLDLLEMAMSSDTVETVKRSRELMDSGIDPRALMSQLAGLIMDIIAGTYKLADSTCDGNTLGGRNLTDRELERLQQALKTLSDAEKQIRFSGERSTWFTAALLQLGTAHNSDPSQSRSSGKQSAKTINETTAEPVGDLVGRAVSHPDDPRKAFGHSSPHALLLSSRIRMSDGGFGMPAAGSHSAEKALLEAARASDSSERKLSHLGTEGLAHIWARCIEKCHSKTLQQLLCNHGKLMSIREYEGVLVAFIAFEDADVLSRAERFSSSITNSLEMVVRRNVKVRMGLSQTVIADEAISGLESQTGNRANFRISDQTRCINSDTFSVTSNNDRVKKTPNFPRSVGRENPFQGPKSSATTNEQNLESAWLQTVERYTPGRSNQWKPERNQVLPQNGIGLSLDRSSGAVVPVRKRWEEELNRELNALKVGGAHGRSKDSSFGGENGYAISPSLLHSSNFIANLDKESVGYESGPGCNGLFCWRSNNRQNSGKTKNAAHANSRKSGHVSLFSSCGKPKASEGRLRS